MVFCEQQRQQTVDLVSARCVATRDIVGVYVGSRSQQDARQLYRTVQLYDAPKSLSARPKDSLAFSKTLDNWMFVHH